MTDTKGRLKEQELLDTQNEKVVEVFSAEEKWRRRKKRTSKYLDPSSASRRWKKACSGMKSSSTKASVQPSIKSTFCSTANVNIAEHSECFSNVAEQPELNDVQVDTVLASLRANFPEVEGLQSVVLGQCVRGISLPKFRPVNTKKKFVQIINVGDHWITLSNVFTTSVNAVYLYNSAYNCINDSAVLQTTSLLRNSDYDEDKGDVITYSIRECCQQSDKTRLCGYYAIAFAISLCNGVDPSGLFYDEQQLIQTVNERLTTHSVDLIPGVESVVQRNYRRPVTVKKLHCLCHSAMGNGSMVQCDNCDNWFHGKCVNLSSIDMKRIRRASQSFTCPECGNATQPPRDSADVIDLTQFESKEVINSCGDQLPHHQV
jgi:hypothetical protein